MKTSPSKIALQAAGRSHSGTHTATEPGICAMCGTRHNVGDPIAEFVPTDSFTDFAALRHGQSPWQCGWCAGLWNADFTQKALKTVMCSDGVFPAASNAHIAYWINNPPEGEWIWVMGDQKRQHIVWRTTVNSSRDIFQVRLGENLATIRRERVLSAVNAVRRLALAATNQRNAAQVAKGKKPTSVALKSPFVRLSRDLDEPLHGGIRDDLHRLALTNSEVMEDIRVLQSSTPGELWAMTAIMYAEPSPERPQPYFSATTQASSDASTI